MPDIDPFDVVDGDVTHVVIELFGGDNNLSHFVREDMEEMRAGMAGRFAMLGLADIRPGGTRVVEISPGAGIRTVEEVGEIDTGDPETLIRFLSRALVTYGPDVRKAIGFWDHGSGVFDEHDPNETIVDRGPHRLAREERVRRRPARRLFFAAEEVKSNPRLRAMLHDDTNAGVLTNLEARNVLDIAFQRAGFEGKVDLIFSDTCLNGMVEVLHQFREHAHCVVGSEELEPGDGWDYQQWFRMMSQAPPATPEDWAAQTVAAFRDGYTDRADQHPCTLGAFRAEGGIVPAFAELVARLDAHGEDGFDWLERARRRAQSFARNYDTYDIRHFTIRLIDAVAADEVRAAAQALLDAFDRARIADVALGETVRNAHGLAFWFPSNGTSYRNDIGTYRRLAFAEATGWSQLLDALYGAG